MGIDEYQAKAARTINHALTREEMTYHALMGLASEVGEVTGLFQKVYQGHTVDREHLQKEIGDVLWMVAELCTAQEFSMEKIALLNIEKLEKRFPSGFNAEQSIHRAEGDV